MRRVLTSLVCRTYFCGEPILKAGEEIQNLYFINKGKVNVADLFSRFLICTLPSGSFFGEYNLFFDIPSNFNFSANHIKRRNDEDQGETQDQI